MDDYCKHTAVINWTAAGLSLFMDFSPHFSSFSKSKIASDAYLTHS